MMQIYEQPKGQLFILHSVKCKVSTTETIQADKKEFWKVRNKCYDPAYEAQHKSETL